jgi:hypothetical protein
VLARTYAVLRLIDCIGVRSEVFDAATHAGDQIMTRIKTLTAAAALAVGALGFAPSAFAWDGCGWGYHQNSWGQCRPNYRPVGYGYGGGYGYGYRPYRPVYGYGYGYRPYRPGFSLPGVSVSFRPY